MRDRSGLIVLFPIVITLMAASPTLGQCEPTWDVTLGNPGISSGYIQPMIAWDDGGGEKLYVGGSAVNIGGNSANDYLAQYDPETGQFSRVGTGIGQGSTNAFLTTILPWDDGTGEKLYVVGQFAFAGGLAEANSFAVWDGSDWSGVGAGFDQTVSRVTYDLLPADLGEGERLYLAGNWDEIGGATVSGLAWYDGEQFGVWGTGGGIDQWGGFSPFVASLKLWDDGSGPAVYACGRFLGIDNAQSRDVARYNVATGEWESFGAPLMPTGSLNNMTSWVIFDDGSGDALYLGGQGFRVAGDSNVYLVAKWDGTEWTGIGQTLSGRVTDLAIWDDGNGPALYISGTATFEVNYFAKLEGDTWVPAQSGVNNPPVNGNFSSAFGLYEWNGDLLVGGNFSQVGGLDPETGVGEGTPIPARGLAALSPCGATEITDFEIVFGSHIEGGIEQLLDSDDDYLRARSKRGFTAFEPNVADLVIGAVTTVESAATIDLAIESRVNNPGGIAKIRFRNWDTNGFDQVAQYNVPQVDATETIDAIDATDFVRADDGRIELSSKHVVIAVFSAIGFDSFYDLVTMGVE